MSWEELRRSLTSPTERPEIPDIKCATSIVPGRDIREKLGQEGIRHIQLPLWNLYPHQTTLHRIMVDEGESSIFGFSSPKQGQLLAPESCTMVPFWLFRTMPVGEYRGYLILEWEKQCIRLPYFIEIIPRKSYPLWEIYPHYLYYDGGHFLSPQAERCEGMWFLSNDSNPLHLSLFSQQSTELIDFSLQNTLTLEPCKPLFVSLSTLFNIKKNVSFQQPFILQLKLISHPSFSAISEEKVNPKNDLLSSEGQNQITVFFP